MPTYTPTQTMFALSMASNLAAGRTGTIAQIEAETFQAINAQLSALAAEIGSWNVIWGPAIYQAPASNMADNVMVVFQAGAGSALPGQLVVGIAGTNPYSAFDWILEDFLVITAVTWAYGSTGTLTPKISLGTFLGLSILQSLMPGPGLPGVGIPLRNFLQSALASPTPITVAGHSLGGALSPAVALWLSDTKAQWDTQGLSTLSCLPSAGPTSGDNDFSTYYGSQLGNVTTRLYNSLDVVSHAWATGDLLKIPELYNPPIAPTAETYGLILAAVGISASKDYTQICLSTPPLQGVLNQSVINPSKSDCDNFAAQAVYQHVNAYFDLLGMSVPSLQAAFAPTTEQLATLLSKVRRKQLIHKKSNTTLA